MSSAPLSDLKWAGNKTPEPDDAPAAIDPSLQGKSLNIKQDLLLNGQAPPYYLTSPRPPDAWITGEKTTLNYSYPLPAITHQFPQPPHQGQTSFPYQPSAQRYPQALGNVLDSTLPRSYPTLPFDTSIPVDSSAWTTTYPPTTSMSKRPWSRDDESQEGDESVDKPKSRARKKTKTAGEDLSPRPAKKYVCPHAACGRAFARNFNLQSHIKSHMNVRDFHCPECPKSFSRRHDCARHCIAVHHYDKHTGKPRVDTQVESPKLSENLHS